MQQEIHTHYCQHFQFFKPNKKLIIQSQSFCKFCLSTNCPLFLCLHKNCSTIVCGKSNYLHLASHLQESKKTKSFHSIFININTAEIRCQYCGIQILDFDQLEDDQRKRITLNNSQSNNPLKFRTAILPYLQDLGQPKIMGQLQYPEGHRKINKGLVGIFADRQNYSVIPALQFIAHCAFFKDVITSMKLKQSQTNKNISLLKQLKSIVKNIEQAYQRAIRIDKFMEYMIKRQVKLIGYKRKDPFQSILDILNILHEHLNFYRVTNVISNLGKDQWDLFYKPKEIQSHCPIYDSLASTLSLNYKCVQCGYEQDYTHQINFVKLDFPKKRKKAKVIEQQLNQKGYQSPRKRGKSLMSLILPEEQLPITIPQLLIQFFKQPFHKEKNCPKCRNSQILMKPGKVQFKKIADILILQINRMPKNTDQIIDTNVLLNYDNLNLHPFFMQPSIKKQVNNNKRTKQTSNQQNISEDSNNMTYEFITAVGIQNGLFPMVCKSKYNNQLYVIKNQSVEMLSKKTKINPYIVCLKRTSSQKTIQFYQEIIKQNQFIADTMRQTLTKKNQLKQSQSLYSKVSLPDFYHIQLKHGIQLPAYQPLVCKHSKIKPFIERKCQQQINITQKMYQHLIQTFKGTQFLNQTCKQCDQQIQLINSRRNKQKLLVKQYDLYKTNANVMISINWLKKWSNFLYSHQNPSYFHKGYPLPPPIDNTVLLDQNKCKPNLVKNKDFKIVNIFVFKLLKQLYAGGPQIRYKWKTNELGAVDETKIRQIRMQAAQLKSIYNFTDMHSPKKSIILQKNSSYMETVNETELEEDDFELEEPIQK